MIKWNNIHDTTGKTANIWNNAQMAEAQSIQMKQHINETAYSIEHHINETAHKWKSIQMEEHTNGRAYKWKSIQMALEHDNNLRQWCLRDDHSHLRHHLLCLLPAPVLWND